MNTLNRLSNPQVKIAVTVFLLIFFQSIAISQNDARFSQLSLEKGVALNLTFDMLQVSLIELIYFLVMVMTTLGMKQLH